MVTTYIDFELVGEKTQEVFNKCVARAKRIVTADNEETAIVRIVSSSNYDNDNLELVNVFYGEDKNTNTDKVIVSYNNVMLPKFGLSKPKDNETDEYVYVVSFNQVWDGDLLSNDCRVYANKEDAIKFFKEITMDEKETFDTLYRTEDWTLEESLSEKYGIGSWEYYLEECAYSNHSYIYLDKKEIRTE